MRLVARRPGKEAIFLLSLEGVTQGDPLAMALFGIAVCPLADILRREFPDVLQPWYADDAAMMGAPADAAACFRRLQELGPHFGYHPSSSKSWCICSAAAEPPSRNAFAALGLSTVKWCHGHRCVGGFVGFAALRDRWVEPHVAKWVEGVAGQTSGGTG